MSSGKWYPYHSLQAQHQGRARPHAHPRPPAPHVSPLTIQPGHGLPSWGAFGAVFSLPVLYRQPENELPVVSVGRKPAPLLPPGDPPSPNTHGEGVDVLVQLVQEADGLDDHIVHAVHVELHLGPGVAVAEAQLCLGGRLCGEALHQRVEVQADPCTEGSVTTPAGRVAEHPRAGPPGPCRGLRS